MRGFRRPTASSARWRRPRRGSAASVTRCASSTPRDFRSVACPTYPEIRLSLVPVRQGRARHPRLRAAGPAHRDRGTARALRRGAFACSRGMRFTTSYHTQFPAVSARALPDPAGAVVSARCAGSTARRVRCMVSTATVRARSRRARLQEPGALAPRRRHRSIQAHAKDFLDAAAPDRRLRRPRRRREEHRRIPEHALARQQDRDRRRPASARGCEPQYPEATFRRLSIRRRSGAPPGRGRRHGVSRAAPTPSGW